MRADDWIINYLINKGVTDVFGIPGVVIMDFLYAIEKRTPRIVPHLNYHEQGAAFAACGYAQVTGKLGVAYSTRGPGFTNMLTAMADAYYDSIPVMFITAHSSKELEPNMRVLNNQEIDTVSLAKGISKIATRIDSIEDLQDGVELAYREATTGRKGPVLLDIWNALFSMEVREFPNRGCVGTETKGNYRNNDEHALIETLEEKLKKSSRPIILIGNGARGEDNSEKIKAVAEHLNIPILSSRSAQDIVPDSPFYYGYVGSRATRYSNFILSKADLIISIGNRLSFPVNSKSFLPIVEKAFTIRIDADNTEFIRQIPNSVGYCLDCLSAIGIMLRTNLSYCNSDEWIKTCKYLRNKLDKYDNNAVISNLMSIIGACGPSSTLVCDVGNHSFWATIAYSYQKASNRIMYSGSFGTLGSALPKSIGAHYATHESVVCFTGDQGVQFNIQELQYISRHRIPIAIVILNNASSGMIMEREVARYGEHLVHTTVESGYSFPDFRKVAECYQIDYIRVEEGETFQGGSFNKPQIIEVLINPCTFLEPSLPVGKVCQNLSPELPKDLYNELDNL